MAVTWEKFKHYKRRRTVR